MIIKIITMISIWYVGWFIMCLIIAMVRVKIPNIRIGNFSILGNSLYTFIPSTMFLIWRYLI